MSTLDLDPRPVPADEVRAHRKNLDPYPHEGKWLDGYPACVDAAARMGVGFNAMHTWEMRGISQGTTAAMWRLWSECGVCFDDEADATADEVAALVGLVGGKRTLAQELGVTPQTIGNWLRGGPSGKAQPLLRWLCDELESVINEIQEAA